MDADRLRDRWRDVAAWLDASASELAGLVVLTAGALAVVLVLWWSGRPAEPAGPPPDPPGGTETEAGPRALAGADTVTVHVSGAVGAPGLVRLPVGARVADAVDGAGGLDLDADPSPLNLAREVTDGERIDVPRHGTPHAGPTGDAPVAGVADDGTIDLNRATTAQLEELPGVGPVIAGRIVAHREAHGPFTEVGQLRDVAGIGEKTFQGLVDLVDV